MVIFSACFEGETYGLLGPQMAATIIQHHSSFDCIVAVLPFGFLMPRLKRALRKYFGSQVPIIGFSNLCGRPDLAALAGELKKDGAITILAGPQAAADYCGEKNQQSCPHYFTGFSDKFTLALQGPAEQILPFLDRPDSDIWQETSGFVYTDGNQNIIFNPVKDWDTAYLGEVHWDNLFTLAPSGFIPFKVSRGQVLQEIGCPWAARDHRIGIDFPVAMPEKAGQKVLIDSKGCSFCDVAQDKGFFGSLDWQSILKQIENLPQRADGCRIPFELINENPFPSLASLINECLSNGLILSNIGLTIRVDGLLKFQEEFRDALQLARTHQIGICLSSVGFESFSNRILRNLNKGVTASTNLKAVQLIRQLKMEFPSQLSYSKTEGGNHGFIHPTPWDSEETDVQNQQAILDNDLDTDILPPHSTPLIIHHDSALGDWIRAVEAKSGLHYPRMNSWIEWWEKPRL